MILSSTPLIDIVPVQSGAIEGRYVCQWDKDSIDDAGFVKIDFLALGALSQLQDAVELIKARTGKRIDMSRIDFEDAKVSTICSARAIPSASSRWSRPRRCRPLPGSAPATCWTWRTKWRRSGRGWALTRRAGIPGTAR